MQQIVDWLEKLGMSEYAQRFAENDIDIDVLTELTDQDLEKLGVSLGHRRRMLRAIRDLGNVPVAATASLRPTATEPAPRDDAERRQLTVMFTDLVGSTALSTKLDPEDLRSIIGAYHKCVAETVARFEGFVAKYMGDGVLVYFGYPQAHEDDPERAVRAGLDLVAAVAALKTHAPLQARVGIATGLVVVGDLIGSGESQERGIAGETPNLAARLQGTAEPNTVVIAESTRRLLGNLFELADLGPQDLKGIAGRVRAFAALRASAAEGRFAALRSATTPLVGRDEEVALLLRRWQRAKDGDGHLVLISGEPGIGKSRLAETLVERLGSEPHTRLRYFCSPHHADSALYPSITQLERAAGFRREDTAEQRLEKLEAVLALGTNDLATAVPLFADLLSIQTERYPPLNLTPQKRKEKTLHAQLAQVEGLAARQPVLMVFEDIHWSDPTTRESLDLLVDRIATLRVLAILTFRPELSPPWLGRPHVTMLTLSRLPPRQRAEMISHITGGKTLPKEIAEQIVERTDGVPLFIEELTKSVVESGIVAEAGDRYAVTGSAPALAIPTSLQGSLLARLDRLAPTREVAQIGSALGRSFTHELISVVAQMPQQQIDDTLAQLVAAELIFRRGTPPDAEYTFKHALVQDAAYSTLLRSRRQQLHARIATTLESRFPEIAAAEPAVLAQHCTEAGLAENAVNYRLKAGQQAVARSAMREAASQLRKGLDLLRNSADDTWRWQHELDLQITLGQALIATRGYWASEVGETYARAHQLCQQLNWPPQFVAVLYGQCEYHLCLREDLAVAHQLADELLTLGEAQNDKAIKQVGHHSRGAVRMWLGNFVAGREDYEHSLKLHAPAHEALFATVMAEDPRVSALISISSALSYLGYADQARARDVEALAMANQLGHAYQRVFALGLYFCNWTVQPVEDTLKRAETVLALSTEHGFPMFQVLAMAVRGWCVASLGQPDEGIAQLQQGVTAWRSPGAEIGVPLFLTFLADAYGKAGRPEEGLKQIAEAARSMELRNERIYEAEMHRIQGELFHSMQKVSAAEASFREGLAVARRQSAKLFELRAATSLAHLWRDQGRRQQAHDLVAPIYGWFTEGFDTLDLKEAKALLEQLSA